MDEEAKSFMRSLMGEMKSELKESIGALSSKVETLTNWRPELEARVGELQVAPFATPCSSSAGPDANWVVATNTTVLAAPTHTRCLTKGPRPGATKSTPELTSAAAPTAPTATVNTVPVDAASCAIAAEVAAPTCSTPEQDTPFPSGSVTTVALLQEGVAELVPVPVKHHGSSSTTLEVNPSEPTGSIRTAHVTCSTDCMLQPAMAAPMLDVSSTLTPIKYGLDTNNILVAAARPWPWPSFREINGCVFPSDAVEKASRRCSSDSSSAITCVDIGLQILDFYGNLSTPTGCIIILDMCIPSVLRSFGAVPWSEMLGRSDCSYVQPSYAIRDASYWPGHFVTGKEMNIVFNAASRGSHWLMSCLCDGPAISSSIVVLCDELVLPPWDPVQQTVCWAYCEEPGHYWNNYQLKVLVTAVGHKMTLAHFQNGQKNSHMLLLPWVLEQEELSLGFPIQLSSILPDWYLGNQSIMARLRPYYSLKYTLLADTWRSRFLCVRFPVQLEVTCSVKTNWLLTHARQLTSDPPEESCCCALIGLNLHITIFLADIGSLGWGAHQALFGKTGSELPLHLSYACSMVTHQSVNDNPSHSIVVLLSSFGEPIQVAYLLQGSTRDLDSLGISHSIKKNALYMPARGLLFLQNQECVHSLVDSESRVYAGHAWLSQGFILMCCLDAQLLPTWPPPIASGLITSSRFENAELSRLVICELWLLDHQDVRQKQIAWPSLLFQDARADWLVCIVAFGGGQGTFQGGRHMLVLYRHKELRLSWDPGGAAAACRQGSIAVIALTTFSE